MLCFFHLMQAFMNFVIWSLIQTNLYFLTQQVGIKRYEKSYEKGFNYSWNGNSEPRHLRRLQVSTCHRNSRGDVNEDILTPYHYLWHSSWGFCAQAVRSNNLTILSTCPKQMVFTFCIYTNFISQLYQLHQEYQFCDYQID